MEIHCKIVMISNKIVKNLVYLWSLEFK